MLYSFARVSAVLGMRRQDYFGQGSPGWLRLHAKGGKRHDVPAHHPATALDEYVEVAGLEEPKVTLFQSVDRAGRRLTGLALERRVMAVIKWRASGVGLVRPAGYRRPFRSTLPSVEAAPWEPGVSASAPGAVAVSSVPPFGRLQSGPHQLPMAKCWGYRSANPLLSRSRLPA